MAKQASFSPKKAVLPKAGNKPAGRLRIFFGYMSNVETVCAMLEAGHAAKQRGTDVVIGHLLSDSLSRVSVLSEGLERLPPHSPSRSGEKADGFHLDDALRRNPRLILLEKLAYRNNEGSRHSRRYQDVEELLAAGIDVYTTVDVGEIESQSDMVAAITGVPAAERIPDSVFDGAFRVEFVDIASDEIFLEKPKKDTLEYLSALREIALRRYADRVNRLVETGSEKKSKPYRTGENVLVCLSPAPSNARIIRTAARMAAAFRGSFTALFVETPDFSSLGSDDKKRLREHMRLAQQLGAEIETVYGDDVPFQIAEFARVFGVSRIVIGRSAAERRHIFGRPPLTERLISIAPELDIHIIPDSSVQTVRRDEIGQENRFRLSVKDTVSSALILLLSTLVGYLFSKLGFAETNVITVYIIGVLIISVITASRIYSLLASIISVLAFNFLFTVPRYTFFAYDKGYPVTFLIMFAAALITGSFAARLKIHARQSAQSAFRMKVLFDTNQLLQKASGQGEITQAATSQLVKLLGRSIVVYSAKQDALGPPTIFPEAEGSFDPLFVSQKERQAAMWVFQNNKRAGATTDTLSDAACLYYAVRVNDHVYGVIGIALKGQPLDAFENSVLLSILGEWALALENDKNAREKEEAAILAQNEQLRANLLRAISHDLRTPLTSICGNASNLLSNGENIDRDTKAQIYTDIYDDAMWLVNLVENLLAVTRIEEGRMNLNLSAELLDEIITEALRHIGRKGLEHTVEVQSDEEFLLVRVDARLIVQVLINIVDNAIKYTHPGSHILISAKKEGEWVVVSVADDGPGIPDAMKPRIFDMFYSGANRIADSRRSLGLGLSLCKSIINAHGGEISVSDGSPSGAVFTFTLPAGEVDLHE